MSRQESNNPTYLHEEAIRFYNEKQFDFAIEKLNEALLEFEKAQKMEKELASCHSTLASCYREKDFHERALYHAEQALILCRIHLPEGDALTLASEKKIDDIKTCWTTRTGYQPPIEALQDPTHKFSIELWQIIANYLPNQSLAHLDQTSKHFHTIFSQDQQGALRKRKLEKLLLHVVRGEQKEVEAILQKNPELILEAGTVIDYSGRKVEGTPFQMAIRAGDEVMAKKIKAIYLNTAANDETRQARQQELDAQFNAVFPDGYDEHLKAQEEKAKQFEQTVLNPLVAAFDNASEIDLQIALAKQDNGSKLCQQLKAFKDAFHALSLQEKVFNPNHLLKVFTKYNEKLDEWGRIYFAPWPLRDLFWRHVIGWVERYLPANYAQAICTGLYKLVKDHQRLKRTMRLYDIDTSQETNFFPLGDLASGLGVNFAAYATIMVYPSSFDGWVASSCQGPDGLQADRIVVEFETYFHAKTASLGALCNPSQATSLRPGV